MNGELWQTGRFSRKNAKRASGCIIVNLTANGVIHEVFLSGLIFNLYFLIH